MSGEKKDRNVENMHEEKGKDGDSPEAVFDGEEKVSEADGEEVKESTEEAVERLSREKEELANRILYLHAELDNFRKRAAKEKEQLIAFGNERLIKELIPILDNLELGMIHGKENEESDQLLSGVELTYNEFLKVLGKFGVEQLDAKDEPFDPTIHEAVSRIADPEKEPGSIYEVVRKGYMLKGRLLRPVQVVVVTEEEKGERDDEDSPGKTIN